VADAETRRPGRNEPCHCGSGKKYKHCHLAQDEEADREARAQEAAAREAEAPAPEEAEPEHAPRTMPPRRPADQPWKRAAQNARGFHKISSPRKVGGS